MFKAWGTSIYRVNELKGRAYYRALHFARKWLKDECNARISDKTLLGQFCECGSLGFDIRGRWIE